jgi:1,4-dihydroxy-2-naphthoate octaprenyltransferase
MAINNFRDRGTDAKAQRKTLATLLTEKQARALPLLFILTANLIVFLLSIAYQEAFLLLGLIAPFIFLKPGINLAKTATGRELNRSLQAAGALIFVQTVLMSVGLILGSL